MEETKKVDCSICGSEFVSKLKQPLRVGGIGLDRIPYYPTKCPQCLEKIRIVDWYGHHRKEPTKELLNKELAKKLKELNSL